MNVTIKITDQIHRAARHRAVDEGLSLSGWIGELIRKELGRPEIGEKPTLLEVLGNDELSGIDLEFPRQKGGVRDVDFH